MRKTMVALLAIVLLCSAGGLRAQEASVDVVYLKNGSIVRGAIVEMTPGQTVKIRTADGSIFVYQVADVDHMTKEEQRGATRNPFTSGRKAATWTLASIWGATFIGAAVMNDADLSTTALPVIGPWATIARVEGGSKIYQPGGKPLLIASGLAQVGALTFMLIELSKEHGYRGGAVAVAPTWHGVEVVIR